MSRRDEEGASTGGRGPTGREGPRPTSTPAPGRSSLVQRRYGQIQRRGAGAASAAQPPQQALQQPPQQAPQPLDALTDSTPNAPPQTAPSSAMPLEVFDCFAVHRDPVQRAAEAEGLFDDDPAAVHAAAARGLTGTATALPHAEAIQRSFGPDRDVSAIRAHVGGPATEATAAMGATAYATGHRVAFAASPDLHTAAHEAAHVFQQQAGVQLHGGVGQAGDAYERHADAVADRVVAGQSAAELFDDGPGGSGAPAFAVQRTGPGPVAAPLALSTHADDRPRIALTLAVADARRLELELDASPHLAIALTAAIVNHLNTASAAVAAIAQVPADGSNRASLALRDVHVDLNKLARSSFKIMRHLGPDRGGKAVAAALADLGLAARPLGWVLPEHAEGAAERARADEPCETDLAHGVDPQKDNPQDCRLSTEQRTTQRWRAGWAAVKVARAVVEVLDAHREALKAAIEADEKLANAVLEVILDVVFSLVSAGAGAALSRTVARAAAAAATEEVTKRTLREAVAKTALDYLRSLTRKLPDVKKPDTDNAARVETIALADQLGEAAHAQLDSVVASLEGLTDEDLLGLTLALERTDAAALEARLGPILRAFEQQLAPIGATSVVGGDLLAPRLPRRLTKRAVQVQATVDQPPAYALVEYAEDADPRVRQAGRAAVAAVADVGRQLRGPRVVDTPAQMLTEAWVNDPAIEIRFITWIDSPSGADFESIVAEAAPVVPAWRVRDLPLFNPHGTPAR
jgi:hypothetical protein